MRSKLVLIPILTSQRIIQDSGIDYEGMGINPPEPKQEFEVNESVILIDLEEVQGAMPDRHAFVDQCGTTLLVGGNDVFCTIEFLDFLSLVREVLGENIRWWGVNQKYLDNVLKRIERQSKVKENAG